MPGAAWPLRPCMHSPAAVPHRAQSPGGEGGEGHAFGWCAFLCVWGGSPTRKLNRWVRVCDCVYDYVRKHVMARLSLTTPRKQMMQLCTVHNSPPYYNISHTHTHAQSHAHVRVPCGGTCSTPSTPPLSLLTTCSCHADLKRYTGRLLRAYCVFLSVYTVYCISCIIICVSLVSPPVPAPPGS